MNRNEEYTSLVKQLEETVPDLDASIQKARHRKARKQFLYKPLGSLAAVFALFVLLVNFSFPVAYACSRVPVLRDLARAVTFSPSLSEAVRNDYVQPVELSQSQNGVTASVEYLIVDQKQVNVFYRLKSKDHKNLFIAPNVLDENGQDLSCSIVSLGDDPDLRCLCIDFGEKAVPDSMQVVLNIIDGDIPLSESPEQETTDYLASFTFPLHFDPQFTVTGKEFPLNQTVTLDGQKITITGVEVYPTHLRVNIQEDPENTAYLRDLHFYLKTDWGMTFEPVANGITATGTTDSPSMISYRADSSYFYQAKKLELVITGAQWLRKDMEKVPLNLTTGEIGALPEGITLLSCTPVSDGWDVTFRSEPQGENLLNQVFFMHYYDPEGTMHDMASYETRFEDSQDNSEIAGILSTLPIRNYPYEEIFLCPTYSHDWTAENEIVLPIF